MAKKWKASWYDLNEVKQVDIEPVDGDTYEEAVSNAYLRYNGKPPAPELLLEEI